MKITLSQLNVALGDIFSNRDKIIDYINKAADSGAGLSFFSYSVCSLRCGNNADHGQLFFDRQA